MKIKLKGGKVLTKKGIEKTDVSIRDGYINSLTSQLSDNVFDVVIPCDNFFITPGLVDVHVHLREPGFSFKETIKTGSESGRRGGYTSICPMPNVRPSPYNLENLKVQLKVIKRDGAIEVIPYGRITNDEGELAKMEELAPYVIGFSDDGFGVQEEALMKKAMIKAKSLGKIIVAHCEDTRYSIYNPQSESHQVARDIKLAKETGCKYHVCHVSTKESVDHIRRAKKEGVDVTCETAPHYLIFTKEDVHGEGNFKMNPPLRERKDQEALIMGLLDGTVDMIATDHAPHTKEEKSRGFKNSLFGIIGLETSFPVLYTKLVIPGIFTIEQLIYFMSVSPKRRFYGGGDFFIEGDKADISIWDLENAYTIEAKNFASMASNTPFQQMKVYGRAVHTIVGGKLE